MNFELYIEFSTDCEIGGDLYEELCEDFAEDLAMIEVAEIIDYERDFENWVSLMEEAIAEGLI